jgi:hypothetical protein
MYPSLLLPWSNIPSAAEAGYRSAGLVKTKGTIFLSPPSFELLRETYNAPPRAKTRMSSGAVALCKHFERGGYSSDATKGREMHPFWKLPVGSNENKSLIAEEILEEMLSGAVWRNVMLLHQGVAVYEVRNGRGYGMRWTLDIQEQGAGKGEEEAGARSPSKRCGERDVKHEEGARNDHEIVELEVATIDDANKNWKITKMTFRGLLEPIEGLDHELDGAPGIEMIRK